MLERLLLKNFQIHEKLDLEFSPTITVIVGRTDSGKSSIIRALRWALSNQPRGSAFLKHGEKTVGVKVKIDGQTLTRSKEGDTNTYALGESSWTAFGTTVPEKIEKFLQVDDLNFQQQHDAPFWLSLSSGEVSRRLNSIVDLEIIDQATSAVKSRLLENKRQVDSNLTRLRTERDRLEALAWVAEAEALFSSLVESEGTLESKSNEVQYLSVGINEVLAERKKIKSKEEMLEDLKPIGKKFQECLKLLEQIKTLADQRESCVKTKIDSEKDTPDTSLIDLSFNKSQNSQRRITNLQNHLTTIGTVSVTASASIEFPELDQLIKEYTELKSKEEVLRILLESSKETKSKIREFQSPESLFTSIETNLRDTQRVKVLTGILVEKRDLENRIKEDTLKFEASEKEIQTKTEGMCPICGKSLS